ncbi:MAG: signal peptidase I [Firmicutes bacterium HGW-Firmicutes-14]|nr:MAG: signal peptidase I [Firmicutes bacterium HGW-Firmicutes-14]
MAEYDYENRLADEASENKSEQIPGGGYLFGDIIESVAIAVVLAVIIRVFLFQPFYIPSASMEPTLVAGDRIIVSKINFRFTDPARWDIVVFKYPVDPSKDFIKRIVGMPGETLQIRDSRLYINGEVVEQPFLPPDLRYGDFGPVKITESQYFVMGDNRNNSDDSRVWGTLPKDNIIGKALIKYWPFERMGLLR